MSTAAAKKSAMRARCSALASALLALRASTRCSLRSRNWLDASSSIEQKLELEKEFKGDAYQARKAREIPSTLIQATAALKKSSMLRDAMGSDVIDHYVRAAQWEQEDFDSKVTDYEVNRGFERA